MTYIYYKGKCELNNFKIYSKNNINNSTINLKLILENEKYIIKSINNYLKLTIKDCNDEQIKLFKENDYYYCEYPICNDDCPISKKAAKCVKGEIDNINLIKYNKCICEIGWIGDKCQTKDFIEFK